MTLLRVTVHFCLAPRSTVFSPVDKIHCHPQQGHYLYSIPKNINLILVCKKASNRIVENTEQLLVLNENIIKIDF